MTPLPHSLPLRVLLVGSKEDAQRLESRLAVLGQYGRVEITHVSARELPAQARPNRYHVLAASPGVLADLRLAIRQGCVAAVRLLVLMPDGAAVSIALEDLPTAGVVSLAALPQEVAQAYLIRLLAALAGGDSLTAAARLAWQQAASDWPEPFVRAREGNSTISSATPPAPPQPARPTADEPGGGRGDINFHGPVTAGQINNITNPSGPITISSPAGERVPDEPPARAAAEQARLNRLLAFMVSACTLEEIETLCFQLGVNHQNFGRLGTRDLARQLIDMMRQRGRVDELVAQLAHLVPERASELRSLA